MRRQQQHAFDEPVTVAVTGRPGVGVGTMRTALRAAGLTLATEDTGDTENGDVAVRVVAEVVKPEDIAAVAAEAARGRPVLVVLNKADLTGFTGTCPVDAAARRSAELSLRTAAPTTPLVALLAVAALSPGVLDAGMLAALRVLVVEPADLSSPDAFVAGPHRLPVSDRLRLVERLDLFGIAHTVRALRDDPGLDLGAVGLLLRRVSRIDEVIGRIDALGAEVRYTRMLAEFTGLEVAALRDEAVDAYLGSPEVVSVRATAATAMMRAAGLDVDAPSAPLHRVRSWRRYAAGPVRPVHRAGAEDIARQALHDIVGQTS